MSFAFAAIGSVRAGRPAEATAAAASELRAPSTTGCIFGLTTTRPAFDALAAEWNELFQRCGRGTQLFQAFNWNWHWCNHYLAANETLAVLTCRQGGRLVMVWPLVGTRVAGLQQLSWMGEPVSQYGDVLIDAAAGNPASLLREAWTHLLATARPDIVWLPKVRSDAAIAPLIAELAPLCAQQRQSAFAARAAAPAAPSAKQRRTQARRCSKLGAPLRFFVLEGGDAARELAARTLAWKRAQLKARGVIAPAIADPAFDAFFADVAAGGDMPAGCRVVGLDCGSTTAAAGIFLAAKDHIVGHVAAFDARFEKASVGMMLLERTREAAFAQGFETFDLLAPADSYKLRLCESVLAVSDWAVPVSRRGALYAGLYLTRMRPAMKALLTALPRSARRRLAAR